MVLLLVSTHQCFYLFSFFTTTDKLLTYCHHYTTWVEWYTYILLSSVFVLWCCCHVAVHLMPVSHRLMCHCCIEIEQIDNKFKISNLSLSLFHKINELLNSLKINVAKISQFAPICRLFPNSYHIWLIHLLFYSSALLTSRQLALTTSTLCF